MNKKMTPQEEYDFYADPKNQTVEGTPRRRRSKLTERSQCASPQRRWQWCATPPMPTSGQCQRGSDAPSRTNSRTVVHDRHDGRRSDFSGPVYDALFTTTPERSADVWLNRVGETWDSQGVIDLLGLTAEQLHAENRTGSVLALSGPDGSRYPVWQFDPDASPPSVRPITLRIAMTFRQALGEAPP